MIDNAKVQQVEVKAFIADELWFCGEKKQQHRLVSELAVAAAALGKIIRAEDGAEVKTFYQHLLQLIYAAYY